MFYYFNFNFNFCTQLFLHFFSYPQGKAKDAFSRSLKSRIIRERNNKIKMNKCCKKTTIEDDMKLNKKTSKRENTNSECYEENSKKNKNI